MATMDPIRRLTILLNHHEARVNAIRMVIDEMHGPNNANGNGHGRTPAVFSDAVAIDEARRKKKPGPKPGPRKPKKSYRKALARRAKVSQWFATVKPGQTFILPELMEILNRTGPYVANGYFKKKRGVYTRTDKPFYATKTEQQNAEEK